MTFLTGIWGYVLALVLGLAIGAFGMHKMDGTALAKEQLAHANDLRAVATASAAAASHALTVEQGLQTQLAASDVTRTQELKDAHDQTAQLSAAVDRGAVQLRIAVAAATPHRSSVPGNTAATRVDDGTVELAPSARQTYFDLRAALQSDQVKIGALQDYARTCSAPQ